MLLAGAVQDDLSNWNPYPAYAVVCVFIFGFFVMSWCSENGPPRPGRHRRNPGRALAALILPEFDRRHILCIQEERRVGNDNTIKWRGVILQIPGSPLRPHFVRATVRVHEYPDGRLAIFHGPHRFGSQPVDLWTTLRVAHNPTGPTTTEAVN
jgi:hypothetical protein